MLAKELMSKNPQILPPTATLLQAARYMEKEDCGFIPVIENGKFIGAVTDRDIAIRGIAAGKDPKDTTLKEVMTNNVQYCLETDEEKILIDKMIKGKIRRIAVLNSAKQLSGIISLGDIIVKTHDPNLYEELVEAVSKH